MKRKWVVPVLFLLAAVMLVPFLTREKVRPEGELVEFQCDFTPEEMDEFGPGRMTAGWIPGGGYRSDGKIAHLYTGTEDLAEFVFITLAESEIRFPELGGAVVQKTDSGTVIYARLSERYGCIASSAVCPQETLLRVMATWEPGGGPQR